MRTTSLAVLIAVVIVVAVASTTTFATFAPKLSPMAPPVLQRSFKSSQLYAAAVPGYSDGPFYIANISGSSHFELGLSWGSLLANESLQVFDALMTKVFGNHTLEKDVFILFAKIQFDLFLKKGLPEIYQQELAGIEQALINAGLEKSKDIVNIAAVLSSFPGDIESNLKWLLIDEFHHLHHHHQHRHVSAIRRLHRDILIAAAEHKKTGAEQLIIRDFVRGALRKARDGFKRSCSHGGVWGSRTVGGNLFSVRNLDWLAQSTITRNKVITIVHPPEQGMHSVAMVGFAGLWGAITGISSAGVTLHESGDDNKQETLAGFQWTMRLRYVAERASTLEELHAMWNATHSTMGINHGLGSAQSKKYLMMETKAGYTAYFLDNDPREKALLIAPRDASQCPWQDGNKPCDHVGAPLPDAVWRTNHAYDPQWLRTAAECMPGINNASSSSNSNSNNKSVCVNAGADTFTRYMLMRENILETERAGALFNLERAVNLSAIVGDKGGGKPTYKRFLTCPAGPAGMNVVSAAFDASARTAYVAYENGVGADHVVAACNNYAFFDLKKFM